MSWFRKLTTTERIDRAEQAKKELALTKEAFKVLGDEYFKDWAATNPKDTELREKIWHSYASLAKVETRLIGIIADGDMARKDLEFEKRNSPQGEDPAR